MLRRTLTHMASVAAAGALIVGLVPPAEAAPQWRPDETSWKNPAATRPEVVDLRYARHEHFDRVVIDIHGRRPGYRTIFTSQLSYDGSGKRVPLKGRFKMYVVLRPAYAYTESGEALYRGPRLVRPGLPTLTGIALTGSFEGDTTFGFTSRKRPYRIFTLTRPSRVIVDFRH